jgi:hypothetical protein
VKLPDWKKKKMGILNIILIEIKILYFEFVKAGD